MGLYLCIFDGDEDIDGIDVGLYADYGAMCDYIILELEAGDAGSRYPTFILHSDCDGDWSVEACVKLQGELSEIGARLKRLSPVGFASDWQRDVAKSIGLVPQNAFESFIDVDGEPLVERLQHLISRAIQCGLPIHFQ